jgi:hypothetical protein
MPYATGEQPIPHDRVRRKNGTAYYRSLLGTISEVSRDGAKVLPRWSSIGSRANVSASWMRADNLELVERAAPSSNSETAAANGEQQADLAGGDANATNKCWFHPTSPGFCEAHRETWPYAQMWCNEV